MNMNVKRLKLGALNAHSLGTVGRLAEIESLLREHRIDVLAVGETWDKEGDYHEITGYRYVGKPRTNKWKGHGWGDSLSQTACDSK